MTDTQEEEFIKYREYLDLFNISDGKYIIGIYQNGITVYKQQIRALNIFHSLVATKVIPIDQPFRIAIIGGGVAGLTFAAAALKSNITVRIFEKESNFLHMQHGCDTRKIHPNVYDWPEPGSLFPNAKLPVLSWTYDTASNVCKQIIRGLEDIKTEIHNSPNFNSKDLYNEYTNCDIQEIRNTEGGPEKFEILHIHQGQTVTYYCDLIIYAVGYGVEVDLNKSHIPSYWRNDALGQSILDDTNKKFLISGVGDGALIDLFRLKIRDFSYDLIFEILRSKKKEYSFLVQKLLMIKAEGYKKLANGTLKPNFYNEEFKRIELSYFNYLFKELANQDKIRKTVEVVLHSHKSFKDCLDFKKISLLNAFLTYILSINKQFTHEPGDLLQNKGSEYYIDGRRIEDVNNTIIRHGTDKKKVIEKLFLSDVELEQVRKIEKKQRAMSNLGRTNSLWTFGQINSYFREISEDPSRYIVSSRKRREYLSPDTIAICSSHVNILAKTLDSFHKRGSKHFRLALHRVIKIDEQFYFQQITSYCGSKSVTSDGGVQNVHPIGRGNVGLSIRCGKPFLAVRKDDDSFYSLMEQIKFHKKYSSPDKDPKAFLTVPILAPGKTSVKKGENPPYTTNLVLYVDSQDDDFFKKEIVDIIISSTKGFIEYINKLIEAKNIYMSELEFDPSPLTDDSKSLLSKHNCLKDLTSVYKSYKQFETILRFKEFHSFDIIYNK
jgi:hypothetical protein